MNLKDDPHIAGQLMETYPEYSCISKQQLNSIVFSFRRDSWVASTNISIATEELKPLITGKL